MTCARAILTDCVTNKIVIPWDASKGRQQGIFILESSTYENSKITNIIIFEFRHSLSRLLPSMFFRHGRKVFTYLLDQAIVEDVLRSGFIDAWDKTAETVLNLKNIPQKN